MLGYSPTVGLERDVPSPVKVRGSGQFNTVQLAHRKPGVGGGAASDPIVLKPCDQSKRERDLAAFEQGAPMVQYYVGTVSGSYRRNRATSMVQDMLCEIGREKRIEVPHVIATVSAAEMDGVPCIAMERLDGKTVGRAVFEGELRYDNEFIRRETWIQLQDVVTGQKDRHKGNVMLAENGPVAIDHDLSFPTTSVDKMPPVIDRNMYTVIMAIDLEKSETNLRECGLTRSEITAAVERTRGLQTAARQLMDQGRVIEPNEWATSLLVQECCDTGNFYAKTHSRRT